MLYASENINISIFEEFGFALIYDPHWSVYLLIGFIGISFFLRRQKR